MVVYTNIHLITAGKKDLVTLDFNSPFDYYITPFAARSNGFSLYIKDFILSTLFKTAGTGYSLIFPPLIYPGYQLYPEPLFSTPVKNFVQFFFKFILFFHYFPGASRLDPGHLKGIIEEWPGNNRHELQQYCWFLVAHDNVYLKKNCSPCDFLMKKFFPGPLQVRRTIPMTHGALPRSRMLLAPRQHLFLFLTAKAREDTRRKDSWQFAGGSWQDENKWGSPEGGRIGQGES